MKTAHKIAIAKTAYRAVRVARRAVGLGDNCRVQRNGINFDLDLAQGIDFAIYLNQYEPDTHAALSGLVNKGANVLDIGANIGALTLHLARLVGDSGRVLAFEPTDYAFKKLNANLKINSALKQRVSTYHCFLSEVDGVSVPKDIYSAWPLAEGSNLHSKHLGQPMPTLKAQSRSIDSVIAENDNMRIDLVKLDVDGFECDVLKGATELLERQRPTFVMELAPYCLTERGTSLQELLSFFKGYNFFDEKTRKRLPASDRELLRMIKDGEGKNIIASAGASPLRT